MDDNCGESVECMGVVVRRYIDFLILLIPTPLVSVLFCSSILYRLIAMTDNLKLLLILTLQQNYIRTETSCSYIYLLLC